ncbi:MAG: hypothetical protein ABWX83_15505 [Luteibacter sp.]
MHTPVRHYRGYDILCSASGYTLLRNDVEVMTVGTRDAGAQLEDCAEVEDHFLKARVTVDRLIDGG